ncbi:MAG: hypothetical protein AB1446_01365 [Bacillota bacterium]
MKKRAWIVVLCLVVLTGAVRAARVIPGLLNEALEPRAEDVSFVGLPVEEAPLNQVWQLFLPWSKDGLGGGDKYLGMMEVDMPVPGGAAPPNLVVVGPGPTVAVEDRGDTRLYDIQGRFIGLRQGRPVGFAPNGALVTLGGPLRMYSVSGEVLWEREPYREAKTILGVAAETASELVQGFESAFVSPSGDVYCSIRIERLRKQTVVSPDAPGITMEQWAPVEAFDACVVYDAAGELVRCDREGIPGKLVFTTRGTAFGAGVSRDGVYSHREFWVEKGRFTLRRTVELPCCAIYAVGKDGSVVGLDVPGPGDAPLRFTVYREGSRGPSGLFCRRASFRRARTQRATSTR